VKIEEGKIVIMKKIFFDTNKATIKAVSNAILGEVAGTLLVHKEIKGVRIEGHTRQPGRPREEQDAVAEARRAGARLARQEGHPTPAA